MTITQIFKMLEQTNKFNQIIDKENYKLKIEIKEECSLWHRFEIYSGDSLVDAKKAIRAEWQKEILTAEFKVDETKDNDFICILEDDSIVTINIWLN